MIALLQRVTSANVIVDNNKVAEIDAGILAFIGIEKGDKYSHGERLLHRVLGYRIFPDDQGKMNLGLKDVKGDLLLVPQFTLAADTKKGMRPSFSSAAPPEIGRDRFEAFCSLAEQTYSKVQKGIFLADMKVSLVNDGPVTFWLTA